MAEDLSLEEGEALGGRRATWDQKGVTAGEHTDYRKDGEQSFRWLLVHCGPKAVGRLGDKMYSPDR